MEPYPVRIPVAGAKAVLARGLLGERQALFGRRLRRVIGSRFELKTTEAQNNDAHGSNEHLASPD
jgi:hypothetical protein